MASTLAQYLGRITPWQSTHPRFEATVSGVLEPILTAGALIETIPAQFDIDTAIGAQLDVDGEWVGRSRAVPVPNATTFFTFDDPPRGFDLGQWKGPYDAGFSIVSLDDTTYRRLLFAVIAANHWDGTIPGAQAVFDIFFSDGSTQLFVEDKSLSGGPGAFTASDAIMVINIAGHVPDDVTLSLLADQGIPIKPAGVETLLQVTSVDDAPLFGFDLSNDYVAGFDEGAFGRPVTDILAERL